MQLRMSAPVHIHIYKKQWILHTHSFKCRTIQMPIPFWSRLQSVHHQLHDLPSGMAVFRSSTPFDTGIPFLATNQYSQLRQEADYIQTRIAGAKHTKQKLKTEIENNFQKLREVQDTRFTVAWAERRGPVTALNRRMKKRVSQWEKCQNEIRDLEDQLDFIFVEIRKLQQAQWTRSDVSQAYSVHRGYQ